MVAARVVRLLSLALCLGFGSACGFFTASTFPETATQLAAQRDLSDLIPSAFSRTFTLSSVTAGGTDLVFLATQAAYSGIHLIVMDKDLNLLQAFSTADLAALGVSSSSSGSPGAIVGVAGDVAIMGLHAAATSAGIVSPAPFSSSLSPQPGPFCVTDGTDNYAGFQAAGNTLSFYSYDAAWGGVLNNYYPYPISTSSAESFNIVGVYDDPARTDAVVIFEDSGSSQDYCFTFPRSSLHGGLLFSPDLQTNYSPAVIPRADNGLIAYSQNGFIKFERSNNGQGGSFIRLDMSGSTLPYSLRYTDDTDIQIATRNAGGWYYEYNRSTRVVRKFTAWWGQ